MISLDLSSTSPPAHITLRSSSSSHLPFLEVTVGKVYSYSSERQIGGIAPGSMPALSKQLAEEGAATKSLVIAKEGKFQHDAVLVLLPLTSSSLSSLSSHCLESFLTRNSWRRRVRSSGYRVSPSARAVVAPSTLCFLIIAIVFLRVSPCRSAFPHPFSLACLS